MGRQIFMVFFGQPRSKAAEHAPENPPVMTVPLILLAVGAVLGGVLNLPGIHTLTDWLEHTLHVHVSEFNITVAALSTVLALLAILVAWLVYGREPMAKGKPDPLRRILGPIFVGMENKWWVDELYQFLIIRPYIAVADILANVIDGRFWHDWFHDTVLARSFREGTRWLNEAFDMRVIDGIANGLGNLTQAVAGRMRFLQTGYVRNYALSFFVGVLLVLSYFIFGSI
jgi:NADH-quinone oxidoreductase subunit L